MTINYDFDGYIYEYNPDWRELSIALKHILAKEFGTTENNLAANKLIEFIAEDLPIKDETWLELYSTELYDYFYKDAKYLFSEVI